MFAPDSHALPPSSTSQALVPLGQSRAIVPRGRFDSSDSDSDSDNGFDEPPAPKRFRLTYEEAKAALEVPVSYKQASTASEQEEWKKAIKSELQALHDKNEGYQSRAKHIDIRHHFIREHVKAKTIDLKYIESKNQLADFLTKPIATKQFERLLVKSKIRRCGSRGSVEVGDTGNTDVQ